MKYVIKNCNCYGFGDTCLSNNADRLYCKDITDCLLKRIVDECKDYKLIAYEGEFYKLIQENAKAKEILELLELEEVDD